jgi:hypothetical protein
MKIPEFQTCTNENHKKIVRFFLKYDRTISTGITPERSIEGVDTGVDLV